MNTKKNIRRFTTILLNGLIYFIRIISDLGSDLFYFLDRQLDALIEHSLPKDHSPNAQWDKESKLINKRHRGFNLTGSKSISINQSRKGLLVEGSTGSGKSTIAIIPSILKVSGVQFNHDPSGELLSKTGIALENQGTQVIPINWKDRNTTYFFNPLQRASSLKDLNKLATLLVELAHEKGKKDYWNQSAIGCLVVVLRIVKLLPHQYKNLFNATVVLDALASEAAAIDVAKYVAIHEEDDPGLYSQFQSLIGSGDSLKGILSSTRIAIQQFGLDEDLAYITSKDTIGDFTTLRQGRSKAIFINSATSGGSYYTGISSIFFSQYFGTLFANLPCPSDHDLWFHFDEAPLLKGLELDVISANIRKYRGSLMIVCQDSLHQLTASYGREKAKSILTNLNTHLYLSCSPDTATQLQSDFGNYEYKDKVGKTKTRPLMTKDELLRLDSNKAIITSQGSRPILARTRPYYTISQLQRSTQNDYSFSPALHGYTFEPGFPPRFDISDYVSRWLQEHRMN